MVMSQERKRIEWCVKENLRLVSELETGEDFVVGSRMQAHR